MLSLFLICLHFQSCKQIGKQVPKNLIPEDKMQNILTDMHLADAVINQNYPGVGGQDSIAWRAKSFRELILNKYHTNQKDFNTSLDYYISNSEILDDMYERMLTHLNKIQSSLQHDSGPSKKPGSKQEIDSYMLDLHFLPKNDTAILIMPRLYLQIQDTSTSLKPDLKKPIRYPLSRFPRNKASFQRKHISERSQNHSIH